MNKQLIGAGFLAASLTLSAQDPQKHADERRVTQHLQITTVGPTTSSSNVTFFSREFAGDDLKPVKNAPYTADTTTETTQTLGDGNRIVNKQTGAAARDSEGRTRRDQSLSAIGPFNGQSMKLIHISDPVSNATYTLDPAKKTATKMPNLRTMIVQKPGQNVAHVETHSYSTSHTATSPVMEAAMAEAMKKVTAEAKAAAGSKRESLGKQMMEGLQVEGTRMTRTIPTGEIGNDRPIDIVSERWYSPELQTTMMSRTVDPRAGETVFRLTNVRRAEPSRDLFEVPADYKMTDNARVETHTFHKD